MKNYRTGKTRDLDAFLITAMLMKYC